MAQELIYTSAPKGIKASSSGFCTVAYTKGMASNFVNILEAYSAYLPVYQVFDDKADDNPVSYSHYRYSSGGETFDIISRICYAGLDYTKRSNKIAHHIVLKTCELADSGPADFIRHFEENNFFIKEWQKAPELLEEKNLNDKVAQAREMGSSFRKAKIWKKMAGGGEGCEGWAGVLAESYLRDKNKASFVIFDPEIHSDDDRLGIIEESIMLLPPKERWQVTFNTYFSALPQGTKCAWRCCVPNSDPLKLARQTAGSIQIDLTKLNIDVLKAFEGSALVKAARSGEDPNGKLAPPFNLSAKTPSLSVIEDDSLSEKTEDLKQLPIGLKKEKLQIKQISEKKIDNNDPPLENKYTSKNTDDKNAWQFSLPQLATIVVLFMILTGVVVYYFKIPDIPKEHPSKGNQKIETFDANGNPEEQKPKETASKKENRKIPAIAPRLPEQETKMEPDKKEPKKDEKKSETKVPELSKNEVKEKNAIANAERTTRTTIPEPPIDIRISKDDKKTEKTLEKKNPTDEKDKFIQGQREFWIHWKAEVANDTLKKGKIQIHTPGQKKGAKIEIVKKEFIENKGKKEALGTLEIDRNATEKPVIKTKHGADDLGIENVAETADFSIEEDGKLTIDFKKEELEPQKPIKGISKIIIGGREYDTEFSPPLPDGKGKVVPNKISLSGFDKEKIKILTFSNNPEPYEKGLMSQQGENGYTWVLKYKSTFSKTGSSLSFKDLANIAPSQFGQLEKSFDELDNKRSESNKAYEEIRKEFDSDRDGNRKLKKQIPLEVNITEKADEKSILPERYGDIKERGEALNKKIKDIESRLNEEGKNTDPILKDLKKLQKHLNNLEIIKQSNKTYQDKFDVLSKEIQETAKKFIDENKNDFYIEVRGPFGNRNDVLFKTIRFE